MADALGAERLPLSPAGAASYSATMRNLYSAEKRRRFGRGAGSCSEELAAEAENDKLRRQVERLRWVQGDPVPVVSEAVPGAAIRLGYARCSTVGQELQSQLDMLARADCTRVFSEKISTRAKERPELEKALALAREIKTAAPNQPVILTVVEMKRLARNAAELMTLSSTLQADGIQLELLSGPLQGVYDPNGAGAIVFAVLAVAAEVEREGIREKTLEGLDTAARKGNHGGRPSVVDDDKLAIARARHAKGESVTAIAKALGISRATLYRHIGESA
ncbi:recombinase family protein [Streptomyces sp. MUM 136J]|uniref:recombinase family protein n=2 Tax=unclassified Streptomyces TaxID=2593676 RepID=UPI001F046FA1|nr:recombinase family protein [Streptomyces sp. MUM 136J]